MEPGNMIAHYSAAPPTGYNWLLVGVVFLVWGLISGLLPRFFQLVILFITPRLRMRATVNRYKVELVALAAAQHKAEQEANYWKRLYLERRDEAEYIPFEEMSDFDQWRTRERWKEQARQDSDYTIDYDITN